MRTRLPLLAFCVWIAGLPQLVQADTITWKAGTQTRNEKTGEVPPPGFGMPPAQPGPATRPPAAALSAFTNSGDVPEPKWTGVEVEADITHKGTAVPALIPFNTMRIAREREFKPDEEIRVRVSAIVSGKASAKTDAGGSAQLNVTRAETLVKPKGGGAALFTFDGSGGVINIGADKADEKHYLKHDSKVLKLRPIDYIVSSDLELSFKHRNATVDYRFLEPKIGPDGIFPPAGHEDRLGLEGVLEVMPEEDKKKDGRTGATAGSKDNPQIFYDSDLQLLTFEDGIVNIADLIGGLSGSVDPSFASDPLVGAVMSISDLAFLGLQPDGSALFSGGSVTIADGGNVFLSGSFSSYRIGDTTLSPILDSFGVFESFSLDSHGFESPLLQALSAGAKVDPSISTDFYFVTARSLMAATSSFSESARMDAAYFVGGSEAVPEPSALILLASGLSACMVLRRRG